MTALGRYILYSQVAPIDVRPRSQKMKKAGKYLIPFLFACHPAVSGAEDIDGNLYLGFNLSSLALDDDRIAAFSTRSPSHAPKLANAVVGYQFNEHWSADITLGTDMDYDRNVDRISLNGYRFFGGNWKSYISMGFSQFDVETAREEQTELAQAGVGVSKALGRNLELRVGYQHFYDVGGDSNNDDEYSVSLNWHFRKPQPAPQAAPEPAPEPVVAAAPAPAPEPAPVEKVVVDVFELLVQFEFDKSDVRTAYRPQFDEIVGLLAGHPETNLTIEGHTCSIGTDDYNQGLSERRANAVRDIFINEHGVDPSRIDAKGYGESTPVADNGTREGRERNRRALGVLKRSRTVTE